jgi:hypothetical protein
MQSTSVITYLVRQEENITIGTGFTLGRVCSLTTLVNLNSRLRSTREGGSSDSPNAGQWQVERSQSETYNLGAMMARGEGIAVHQTSVVHVDENDKAYFSRRDPDVSPRALLRAEILTVVVVRHYSPTGEGQGFIADYRAIYVLHFKLRQSTDIISNIQVILYILDPIPITGEIKDSVLAESCL